MRYRRLTPEEFDLAAWEEEAATGKRAAQRDVSPEEVARILSSNGGRLPGAINAPDGLVGMVRIALRTSKAVAAELVKRAVGVTIEEDVVPRNGGGRGASGGKPQIFYRIKPTSATMGDDVMEPLE